MRFVVKKDLVESASPRPCVLMPPQEVQARQAMRNNLVISLGFRPGIPTGDGPFEIGAPTPPPRLLGH